MQLLIDQYFLFSLTIKILNLKTLISCCFRLHQNEITITCLVPLIEIKLLTASQELTMDWWNHETITINIRVLHFHDERNVYKKAQFFLLLSYYNPTTGISCLLIWQAKFLSSLKTPPILVRQIVLFCKILWRFWTFLEPVLSRFYCNKNST